MKYCRGCKERKELIHFYKCEGEIFTQCSGCRSLPRVCTRCRKIKPVSEYYLFRRSEVYGYAYEPVCKFCRKLKEKDNWYRAHLKRKYGITLSDYDNLLEAQGGVCAICKSFETDKRRGNLSVDHDHETGKIRGLLCNRCNRGIGYLKDNPEILEAAARYLRESA